MTLPETATAIGNLAFNGCTYLRSIVIPDGITAIGDYAFYGCVGLANIGIPSGLTAVGQYAFFGCDMKSIEMPSGVKTIGSSAFSDCYNLTTIVVLSVEPPVIGNGSSTASCGLSTGCTIYVPAEAVDNYKDNTQWAKYANQIQAIPE